MNYSPRRHRVGVTMNDHIPRRHDGQCGYCGAFRTDGRPVTVHFHRCQEGPDGEQVGTLRVSRYHLGASRAPSRAASDIPEQWRHHQRDKDRQRRKAGQ
jgi:hypothetical protein